MVVCACVLYSDELCVLAVMVVVVVVRALLAARNKRRKQIAVSVSMSSAIWRGSGGTCARDTLVEYRQVTLNILRHSYPAPYSPIWYLLYTWVTRTTTQYNAHTHTHAHFNIFLVLKLFSIMCAEV